jgi:hypothetical protein
MTKLPDIDWEPWFKYDPPLLQLPPWRLVSPDGITIIPEPNLLFGLFLVVGLFFLYKRKK